MSFSPYQILLFIVVYLSLLFAVALLADRGVIPRRVTSHPAVYVLSLGVFAGAIATNAIFLPAREEGNAYLLYYAGVAAMFVLAPLLLLPLLRLCRVHQLTSAADVLTFRFRSAGVGATVTVAMCLTLLPLLALQIQTVSDSIHIMAGQSDMLQPGKQRTDGLALLFCVIITIFSILFGTRHISSQQRNTGLVTAMAFESLVKLGAMLILMLYAVMEVFGGFAGLEQWLVQQVQLDTLRTHSPSGAESRALLLLFFAGAICMPHMFHMAFAENARGRDLRRASWGLPLYLLALSLPVLPLVWAGMKLQHPLPVEYSGLALGLELHSNSISAIAFVAGLSASSAVIVVSTLALANMCLNHLLLPGRIPRIANRNLFDQLKWLRRGLISLLIIAGYTCYVALDNRAKLPDLGLTAFVGVLQFLPGLAATPYFQRASRRGLLAGLGAGLLAWVLLVVLPVLFGLTLPYLPPVTEEGFWAPAILLSLGLNGGLLIAVSLLTGCSEEERVAAEICASSELPLTRRQPVALRSTAEFIAGLAGALGADTARGEVHRALRQLQFTPSESRPYALQQLRNRIEANLSGLLGTAVAQTVVSRCLPLASGSPRDSGAISLLEQKLEGARFQFTGLAADLDSLRRHYRQILHNLPVGVCSSDSDGEILLWNLNLETVTGISASSAVGGSLHNLRPPWGQLLGEFAAGEAATVLKREYTAEDGQSRWISLHRAAATADSQTAGEGQIILVEDITDYELLEQELLHNERLASIGRLAAGVAHEIGNPVTGIACLAQNLAYETEPEAISETAEDILKQTERVTRIVQSLVNFSHGGSHAGDVDLVPCNLADCIDEAIHLLQLDREAPSIAFDNRCDRELVVRADAQRLLQVFVNLLSNARDACDACDSDGRAVISARADAGEVLVMIEDNGSGIPRHLREQVFEPFFTTKEPGAGTGLGLALVYSIIEDFGGSISLRSPAQEAAGVGTCITLRLQRARYGGEFPP